MDMVSHSPPAWSYAASDSVEYGDAVRHILARLIVPDPSGALPVEDLMAAFGLGYQATLDCCFDAGFCDVANKGQFIAARWRFRWQG